MSITKNLIKLFVVMLVATLLLSSCDLFKKGGNIIVINELDSANYVLIVKIDNLLDLNNPNIKEALKELQAGKGTEIKSKGKKTFTFNEDGVYAVTALKPASSAPLPVTLIGGITETVKIVPKDD